MAFIIATTGAYALSRFTDQALADSLGLRTLRVSTDPLSWIKSHFQPLDTKYVGNMSDEYGIDFSRIFEEINQNLTQLIDNLCPGKFQQIARTIQRWTLQNQIISAVQNQIKAISPFVHDFLFKSTPLLWLFRKCTMHTVSYLQKTARTYRLIKGSEESGNIRFAASLSLSLIAALFIPTLKLRYREAKANETFRDTFNGNVVLFAKEKISPLNIGILGTLKNSIGIPSCNKVMKVALGVSKLAVAGAVAYGTYRLCPTFIESHKTALIAGAAFALI